MKKIALVVVVALAGAAGAGDFGSVKGLADTPGPAVDIRTQVSSLTWKRHDIDGASLFEGAGLPVIKLKYMGGWLEFELDGKPVKFSNTGQGSDRLRLKNGKDTARFLEKGSGISCMVDGAKATVKWVADAPGDALEFVITTPAGESYMEAESLKEYFDTVRLSGTLDAQALKAAAYYMILDIYVSIDHG